MPTLVVGMRIAENLHNMPTASVGMAPINFTLTEHWLVAFRAAKPDYSWSVLCKRPAECVLMCMVS
jgi:hypothetical protein